MEKWLLDLAPWFGCAAGLLSVGVAFGSLPRLRTDLDEHKRLSAEDRQRLWDAVEDARKEAHQMDKRLVRVETQEGHGR